MKGIADECPAFKSGCSWKRCTTVGEYLETMGKTKDAVQGKSRQQKVPRLERPS